ncbi:MAG: DNA polymerase delta catalytic subunit [Solivirus sp.]|uniref:DNA polymerase n=1 Tax=Solivirus sp. TaxID=2487772 RepID=A0A3G5AFU7_9VIRU|nr:MAG: DNA polymerase delta catalytic subunit [Solivirus sp.]
MSSSSSETLNLQAYQWEEETSGYYTIRIACHNRDSEIVLLRVEDYKPYCIFELPSTMSGVAITWTQDALLCFKNWLMRCLDSDAPVNMEYYMQEKLIYYSTAKFPVIKCYFDTLDARKHCVNLLKKRAYDIWRLGTIKATVHETEVSDLHKFVTDCGLQYACWLSISEWQPKVVDDENKISCASQELIVSYKDLIRVSDEVCKLWTVTPKIAGFDFECYSSNPLAMPNPLHLSDVVFQCSYIIQRLGDPKSRKRYLLQLGPCKEIADCEVRRFGTEIDLFNGLAQLIKETNPSIITGYNIFRFDLPYMDDRMKHYMRETLTQCGIILDQETKVSMYTWRSGAYGFMTISSLTTFGRIYVDMHPIIKRDYKFNSYTLDAVSNHFLERGKHDVSPQRIFAAYKELCAAQKWFIELEKDNRTEIAQLAAAKIRLNEALDEMKTIAEYCLEDSVLCIDLFEKLNVWLGITILANVVEVQPVATFARGQQIRVLNQLYSRTHREKVLMDSREEQDLSFTGAIVVNPIIGAHEYMMIFDFAAMYPSIIIAYNLCYRTLVPPERTDIPDEDCHVLDWTEEEEITESVDEEVKSQGIALVYPDGKAIELDAGETLSPLIHIPEGCSLVQFEKVEIETKTRIKKIVKHYHHRFVKAHIRKGILPQICEDLVNTRNATKAEINPQNDPVKNLILETKGNALKISANSVYGGLSARYGKPLIEAARVVTYCGRKLNLECQEIGKQNGMNIIYGDTDSIMTTLVSPITDPRKYKKIGDNFAALLSSKFQKPLRVESEGTCYRALILKPKMYATIKLVTIMKKNVISIEEVPLAEEYGIGTGSSNPRSENILLKVVHNNKQKVETDFLLFPKHLDYKDWVDDCVAGCPVLEFGEPNTKKINKKGIIIARRDNCIWVRDAYLKILMNILFKRPIDLSLQILNEAILKMMARSVHYRELLINKEIGTEYKANSSYPMKIFADELKKRGITIEGGERIDYLIVRLPIQRTERGAIVKQKQGYKMRLLNDFLSNFENEPIDTLYYVENQMKNRLDALMQIGYSEEVITSELSSLWNVKKFYTPVQSKRGKANMRVGASLIANYVKLIKQKSVYITNLNMISDYIQKIDFVDSIKKNCWRYYDNVKVDIQEIEGLVESVKSNKRDYREEVKRQVEEVRVLLEKIRKKREKLCREKK